MRQPNLRLANSNLLGMLSYHRTMMRVPAIAKPRSVRIMPT
ncbi:MAG: hypothetical protein ACRAVC_02675 [Trichormus sp.]